ncbi:hypothetical protein GCM10009850_068410 [Nonomuraea monospora]|uniref:Uncharacterized protein n=1 Tax=Nonomuraea monospora TaxID=568818 RepID=A0ABP5PI10_9ACTN
MIPHVSGRLDGDRAALSGLQTDRGECVTGALLGRWWLCSTMRTFTLAANTGSIATGVSGNDSSECPLGVSSRSGFSGRVLGRLGVMSGCWWRSQVASLGMSMYVCVPPAFLAPISHMT